MAAIRTILDVDVDRELTELDESTIEVRYPNWGIYFEWYSIDEMDREVRSSGMVVESSKSAAWEEVDFLLTADDHLAYVCQGPVANMQDAWQSLCWDEYC